VALTFDACPGAFDMRIASVLVGLEIPGTIFVTALWMRRNPEGPKLLLTGADTSSLPTAAHVRRAAKPKTLYVPASNVGCL
jgi:peptidoglycan/xylan/chitin deacetylase (PgdA/CDA1 family)